jgi:hypothetical protein
MNPNKSNATLHPNRIFPLVGQLPHQDIKSSVLNLNLKLKRLNAKPIKCKPNYFLNLIVVLVILGMLLNAKKMSKNSYLSR